MNRILKKLKHFVTKTFRTLKFEEMYPNEQRVAIAKDVLEQLKLEKYIATHGTYATTIGIKLQPLNQETLTQDFIPCKVCAVGSAALSVIRKSNDFFGPSSLSNEQAHSLMTRFFPEEQCDLMERIFEGFTHSDKFYGLKAHDRLKAIWENVITNDGEFVP